MMGIDTYKLVIRSYSIGNDLVMHWWTWKIFHFILFIFTYLDSWTSRQVSFKIYFPDTIVFYQGICMDMCDTFWVVFYWGQYFYCSIFWIPFLWWGISKFTGHDRKKPGFIGTMNDKVQSCYLVPPTRFPNTQIWPGRE